MLLIVLVKYLIVSDPHGTLMRYVKLYNTHLPQSALRSKTPYQAMKDWYAAHPHLFHRRPYDRPGCDSYTRFRKQEELKPLETLRNLAWRMEI